MLNLIHSFTVSAKLLDTLAKQTKGATIAGVQVGKAPREGSTTSSSKSPVSCV